METVLYPQHIEATRLFILSRKDLTLRSITGEIWLPGEIKQSSCHHARAHGPMPPEAECTCGIWSCKSRKYLNRVFPPMVYGRGNGWFEPRPFDISARVEQWGVIIEHEMGYRSEFARIIPETIQMYPRPQIPTRAKLIKYLRSKYDR